MFYQEKSSFSVSITMKVINLLHYVGEDIMVRPLHQGINLFKGILPVKAPYNSITRGKLRAARVNSSKE